MIEKPTRRKDDPLPVDTAKFWRERVFRTIARGDMLHQIIYDNSYDVWKYLQGETAGHLRRHVRPHASVLDVGCGYGALVSCFEEAHLPVRYHGIDLSPDLIELAEYRYGSREGVTFERKNLFDMVPTFRYDWVIARSVEGMVIENRGPEEWGEMFAEMRKHGRRVLLMDYPEKVGDEVHVEIHEGVV